MESELKRAVDERDDCERQLLTAQAELEDRRRKLEEAVCHQEVVKAQMEEQLSTRETDLKSEIENMKQLLDTTRTELETERLRSTELQEKLLEAPVLDSRGCQTDDVIREQDSSPQSDQSAPMLNSPFGESEFYITAVDYLTTLDSRTDSESEPVLSQTQVEAVEKCEVPQKSADVESKYCETGVMTEDWSELEELREELRKTEDALKSEREEVELLKQQLSELEPLEVCRLVECVP